MKSLLALVLLASALPAVGATASLTPSQAGEIGQRIWKNECAGTIDGLTSWNKGEEFPSLGIAHFIWYPTGVNGPFEESFPGLVRFLLDNGIKVESWMTGSCPWESREAFMKDFNGPRLTKLRKLLADTVGLQARYAAIRMEKALPKMLAAAEPSSRDKVKSNFNRVAAEPLGFYALVDYVNFKGEGVNPSERYGGRGWGLLQVLEAMPSDGPALPAFAKAADQVLTQRIKNSPPARNEGKWLPGWRNRLQTYTR